MNSYFEGLLEKRSRARSFLAISNWKTRTFKLIGQDLSYSEGTTLKGEINTNGAEVRKVKSEDADGRVFAFELILEAKQPNEERERLLLNAESEPIRMKWMSVLNASSRSASWTLATKSIQSKTGLEIASALISAPKDDSAVLIVEGLKGSAIKHELEEKIALEKNEESRKALVRQKAAFMVQSNFRRYMARRRVRVRKIYLNSAIIIQRAIRVFIARCKLGIKRMHKMAKNKLTTLLIMHLYHFRTAKNLAESPNTFSVFIKNVEALPSKNTPNKLFVYTMCCYDDSGHFKGADETNVKNGYGLRSTSVHKSQLKDYHPEARWDELAPVVNSTKRCFIVLSVFEQDASAGEKFMGQAIVALKDFPQIYKGLGIEVTCSLMKYVAPIEDLNGTAIVGLNSAIAQKTPTGSITFVVRLPSHTMSMSGWLWKEQNGFNKEFKKRYFVLLDGYLTYATSPSELGGKGSIKLSDVISIEKELKHHKAFEKEARSSGKTECIRITFKKDKATTDSWLFHFLEEDSPRVKRMWLRKIHRNCPKVPDPDMVALRAWMDRKAAGGAGGAGGGGGGNGGGGVAKKKGGFFG